ncbi:MAG: nucleotidyltransferase family protein, partial [Candidatus Neomarinimicrobiota bacterium]
MITEQQFIAIILKNKALSAVAEKAARLELNNWYVGAGVLCQTYWNYVHGFPLQTHIRDIDLVYFEDADLSWEKENEYIQKAQQVFKTLSLKIDLKNQARVHLWYAEKFGYEIKPYDSIKSAIDTWPTTATAMGLTKT